MKSAFGSFIAVLAITQITSCDSGTDSPPILSEASPVSQTTNTDDSVLTSFEQNTVDPETEVVKDLGNISIEDCPAPPDWLNGEWTISSLHTDVDNDGLPDFVELLAGFPTTSTKTNAIVKVTFGNGGVVAGDGGLIYLLPEGNTITALDLHHEPDGSKELIFNTHYGYNLSLIQKVMVYENCSFVETESDKDAIGNKLAFRESTSNGDGNTSPANNSWGCSTDEKDSLSVQTLRTIGSTVKTWWLDTWHLVDSRWVLVSTDSGQGEDAPEPLVNCLTD